MNRLSIATKEAECWRSRLASPESQWKQGYSAMEAAISWELAATRNSRFATASGLPATIEQLFVKNIYGEPLLMSAVAEHTVDLEGVGKGSQTDIWAIVRIAGGLLSLTVEAKAEENFGDKVLDDWLAVGTPEDPADNRQKRWKHIRENLPPDISYGHIRYQLLHRCAAAVMEAKRWNFKHAAFIVQAFGSPTRSFEDYSLFCAALGLSAQPNVMAMTFVNGISLSIGWADCPFADAAKITAAKIGTNSSVPGPLWDEFEALEAASNADLARFEQREQS